MQALIDLSMSKYEMKENIVHFIDDEEENARLNDLTNYPHLFVLSCLMDRQIKAERAWSIPGRVAQEIGSYRLEDMAKVSLEEYKNIFNKLKLHRFNDVQAGCFYNGVQKIMKDYQGNAANIWNNEPSSATVVRRFLEFDGAGIKIATMATNILARQYKIKLSDFYSIDISPDVHVKRIFYRTGLIDKKDKDNIDMIIYKAREIYPQFPGLIDFACWDIGRNWCTERKALCSECPLNEHCKKNI
ncbi:MAG: iron-sulfur cluster loop [Alphaproteobacteria bacterium]|nr:iron-sulfur cluster loop [Alphaproteobacteria bacterium]